MARCLRCKAGNEWIDGDIPRPRENLRVLVLRLYDELHNGVRYNRKRNEYVLVYTKAQLRNARRRAARLIKAIRVE